MKNTLALIFKKNIKIIENYFYMTFLQVLNSFFYFLLYPYLIRTLGSDSYGLYIYATSIITYFIFLINFGFHLPATRLVAINSTNPKELSSIFSTVFISKNILFFICITIFFALLTQLPIMRMNSYLFFACFIVVYSHVLLPLWFFQGMQDLKAITLIQLSLKITSIPLIILLVKDSTDLNTYALIVSLTTLFSSLLAIIFALYKYKIRIRKVSISQIKELFNDSRPFFYSSLAGTIKDSSIPIILGAYFGMKEVAIYDLANKIIMLPRTLFMSVNSAIFPKLIVNTNKRVVKNIIRIEYLIAILTMLLIAIFGKFVIQLLGGVELIEAYYLALPLSFTIMSWLVVGAYINFTFIPNNLGYLVTYNQLLATAAFFITCLGGLSVLWESIYMIGIAILTAGLVEILFCVYTVKRLKLL